MNAQLTSTLNGLDTPTSPSSLSLSLIILDDGSRSTFSQSSLMLSTLIPLFLQDEVLLPNLPEAGLDIFDSELFLLITLPTLPKPLPIPANNCPFDFFRFRELNDIGVLGPV
jgi:hypothetical protein